MEWMLIALGIYLCYYTVVYTKIVWEENKKFASLVLLLIATSLLIIPFIIVFS